jgi:hypothetical protein
MTTHHRLPQGFDDLEQFVDRWSAATSHERWQLRCETPYPEIVRFYEAMLARAEEATTYLERFPLAQQPGDAACLMRLLLAMTQAAVAVELHQAARVAHSPWPHQLQIVSGMEPHG